MRYVAVSRPNLLSPMEIVGVGETMEEAYAGARAWFERAFDMYGGQKWNELVAMQNNLDAVSEDVLRERTGVTLDEWLARLASVGQAPGTPQPPKPPVSPGYTKLNTGWELHVWVIAGILIIAPPIVTAITYSRMDLPNGMFFTNNSNLLIFFLFSLVGSIIGSAFWFYIFRRFKDDATLQDYLFFLFILKFARIAFGLATGGTATLIGLGL
jgi:hypothetical protein